MVWSAGQPANVRALAEALTASPRGACVCLTLDLQLASPWLLVLVQAVPPQESPRQGEGGGLPHGLQIDGTPVRNRSAPPGWELATQANDLARDRARGKMHDMLETSGTGAFAMMIMMMRGGVGGGVKREPLTFEVAEQGRRRDEAEVVGSVWLLLHRPVEDIVLLVSLAHVHLLEQLAQVRIVGLVIKAKRPDVIEVLSGKRGGGSEAA